VRIVRSDVTRGHPEYYQDYAARLAQEIPGAFYVNQFGNPRTRTRTSAPPARDLGADAARRRRVRGRVGSSGTITGLSRFFSRVPRRGVEMILADPEGRSSSIHRRQTLGEAGSWAVEGIGEDFIPTSPTSRSHGAFSIPDARASRRARVVAQEGILGGPRPAHWSRRRCVTAASRRKEERVVTFICDTGNKYLSKMYNDFWMAEQGLRRRESHGDSARPHRASP
jgi:cystathionine beta-synthase